MSDASAPEHLSAGAAAAWAELTAGWSVDQVAVVRPALAAYAVQVARLRDAQARIDREGLVVADEKGRPVPHPAVAIERAASAEVRAWAASPAAQRPRTRPAK